MNAEDIQNISILTEALRGRDSHKGIYETILVNQQKQNLPPEYVTYWVYATYNSYGADEIAAAEEVKVNIAGISFEEQVQVALVTAAHQMQKSRKRDPVGFVDMIIEFNKWRGFENTDNNLSPLFQVDWTDNSKSMYLSEESGIGFVISRNKDQIEPYFDFIEQHWG